MKVPDTVHILLTDSRSLSEPAVSLFFALCTEHNDGHRYILDLYEKGVRNFVVQHDFEGMDLMPEAQCFRVENTLAALQQIAAEHRRRFDIPLIGITGSNGKTIVKEWLYQLLHDRFAIVRSPRSYNSQTGVPLSIWQLNHQTQLGIFEAGISLPGEMEKLAGIICPTIGIFTTIGEAHQENFFSQEEKCIEKLALFEKTEKIIYNEDQLLVKYCMEKKGFLPKTFSWSVRNENAGLFIRSIQKKIDHTLIEYRPCRQNPLDGGILQIPFTDDASVEDAIHCLAFILCQVPDLDNLAGRFGKLDPVAMRLDVSKGINGNTLINDTYNSDINSLSIALDFMARRSGENQLKQVLILSDIQQSGMVPAAFYSKVAEIVHQTQLSQMIGIRPT
jgi:alanine racemase